MIYGGLDPEGLDDLQTTVETTTALLELEANKFDSIACQGMSGVVVGAPVSLALGKPLVIVRKDDDSSHHGGGMIVNRKRIGERVLFLDDFVSEGTTRTHVAKQLGRENSRRRVNARRKSYSECRIVGTFAYRDMLFTWNDIACA